MATADSDGYISSKLQELVKGVYLGSGERKQKFQSAMPMLLFPG
jgi:hypothetical protein